MGSHSRRAPRRWWSTTYAASLVPTPAQGRVKPFSPAGLQRVPVSNVQEAEPLEGGVGITKNGPRTGGRETAQQHDEKPPGWCVDAVRPGEYNGGRRTRQARKRVKRVCPDLRSTSPLGVTSTARALLLVAETDTESQFLNKDRRNGPGSSSVQPWTRLGRASRPRLAKRASPERI